MDSFYHCIYCYQYFHHKLKHDFTFYECRTRSANQCKMSRWTAPTNPNGVIVQYQININPGKMDQANITSVATKTIVDNLIPGMLFVSLNIFIKKRLSSLARNSIIVYNAFQIIIILKNNILVKIV